MENRQRKVTKVLLRMKVKWYKFLELLVGVILGFADPITDILTVVEFYRADHKTWFGVALTFVILPCLFFLIVSYCLPDDELEQYTGTRSCAQRFLCGFHPFSAAWRRIEGFRLYLKKMKRVGEIDSGSSPEAQVNVENYIFSHVLFESVVESAPQFVIQLYVMNVQEEPLTVIQIISLPVSFLSLAWAFTFVDVEWDESEGNCNARKVKYKLAVFVSQVLLLSSRLFAICYFTVSYKWWVMAVLSLHIFVLAIADTVWFCQRDKCKIANVPMSIIFHCVIWLRDDVSGLIRKSLAGHDSNKETRRMQLFSNILFVLENLVMTLLYYFTQHSNNWYSLPVTVCVCVLSVLAAVTRVTLYHFLYKDLDDETVNLELGNNNNTICRLHDESR